MKDLLTDPVSVTFIFIAFLSAIFGLLGLFILRENYAGKKLRLQIARNILESMRGSGRFGKYNLNSLLRSYNTLMLVPGAWSSREMPLYIRIYFRIYYRKMKEARPLLDASRPQ